MFYHHLVTEPMSLVDSETGIVVAVGFDMTGFSVKTLSWQALLMDRQDEDAT